MLLRLSLGMRLGVRLCLRHCRQGGQPRQTGWGRWRSLLRGGEGARGLRGTRRRTFAATVYLHNCTYTHTHTHSHTPPRTCPPS